ncbi:testis-specific serine/threonine-protein kinase 5-like [Ornithorhynchus anatinus]|uniref:testis-specific serine/threonine-protein kinase 5-like n=1 Tax=Ornithorhynchus anatinus TaxID=9258 RepID=UPI00028F336D|nr:testis-specific serine/threonine-protein kinase 5-like [Ornithorhynchus anatinus]XP_028918139.1 testis-specific serine/threonine-protein kinase 5-like [Ornithorhynchus anatinus]
MRSGCKRESDRRTFMDQVRECKDSGYLLSAKKIGSGAFSKVYLGYATHDKLRQNAKLAADLHAKRHTMVAIKIISMAEAPVEFAQKFLPREIYSLNATYKHLNVIQLYETYRNSKRSYLVLELAPRGDLLEYINTTSDRRRCPGLEEEEARRLFRQLVSAVAHCHSTGIVHRDLKCENILLDECGFLKLTDFGFASRSARKNSLLSTFCGSVAYTAPEILMSKKYNGERADLWSLGVILYAMVTGKLPFKEHLQPHKMLHLMRQGLTFRPSLSCECRDLIQGLLQLQPGARLGLQQVATHCWMLPATSALFYSVLSAAPPSPPEEQLVAGLQGGGQPPSRPPGHSGGAGDPEKSPVTGEEEPDTSKTASGRPSPHQLPAPAADPGQEPPPWLPFSQRGPHLLTPARPGGFLDEGLGHRASWGSPPRPRRSRPSLPGRGSAKPPSTD